jgi:hypothetical protein
VAPADHQAQKEAAEDEEKEEDEVEPADEEDASEEEDDEPPSPAEKKKKKPAPKGPVHRRDRNRVNARNSRAKKEHYIKWLEIKAGVTVTSQGGKDRKDAVEAAWEEEEERGGGRGGGRGGRLREKEEEPRRRGPDLPIGCQETGKEEEVNGTEAAYARTDHAGAATKDTRGHPGAH